MHEKYVTNESTDIGFPICSRIRLWTINKQTSFDAY